MRSIALTFAVLLATAVPALAAGTMRVDYFHTGNARQERFSLDRIVLEPLPWPGNPDRPIDDTNLGKYLFEVVDAATGRVLYSSGFSSIYGEWETTAEARRLDRAFSESLRFPAVERAAHVSLKKRDARNAFVEVWALEVDPDDPRIVSSVPAPDVGPLIRLHEAGDPARKLDLLLIGDGYTAAEREKFERDARRMMAVLFETAPFSARRDDINVWGLVPAAAESGVAYPSRGMHPRSPLGTTYDVFGSERYLLTFDNRALRDAAAHAPYDVVEILVNSSAYGGGGIFGLYSTVAVDSPSAPYVFLHEFGHHIAGLADEYVTEDVAYLPPDELTEPWEPNVTALADPAALKWGDLVTPGVPVPTPLPQEAGVIGAFEGANYLAEGFYRPAADCVMFSRATLDFCAVCLRAIDVALDRFTRG